MIQIFINKYPLFIDNMIKIPLIRLRMTFDNYNNLKEILELIHDHGIGILSDSNPNWIELKTSWQRRQQDGLDLGDIRSTLPRLGIIDRNGLTSFGDDLYKNRNDGDYLKIKLAKKMILDNNGWAYCHILYSLSGKPREDIWELYKETYDSDLQEQFTDISKYNLLLKWLGIAIERGNTYEFDLVRFEELIGFSFSEFEQLDQSLSYQSKLCFLSLCRIDPSGNNFHQGKDIREIVEQNYGERLSVHKMQHYATELVNKGLITYRHRGNDDFQRGRVGEWKINVSSDYHRLIGNFLENFFLDKPDWDLKNIVQKSFSEILQEVRHVNTDIRGHALETFAAKICWVLGIRNIKRRDTEKKGVELDVTGDKIYPIYTNFLVQCKNYGRNIKVGPPIIAKEIGTASKEKFNNILIFSTTGFTGSSRQYVKEAILSLGINIMLFDDQDLVMIAEDPKNILKILERENRIVKTIRTGDTRYWLSILFSKLLPDLVAQNSWSRNDFDKARSFMLNENLIDNKISKEEFKEYYLKLFDSE